MSTLQDAIKIFNQKKSERLPADMLDTMAACTQQLKDSRIEARALHKGDRMPDFELPDQRGRLRRMSDYLAESPVVLNIYRGGWCPYCNLEMKALHDALPQIEALGARLVGLTPETPDKAADTATAHDLAIDILSDAGNKVAASLGLVFELPSALREVYEKLGTDLPAYNGDRSFTLPVPATYIIERDGEIIYDFVNADYTHRLEPEEILTQLKSMSPSPA